MTRDSITHVIVMDGTLSSLKRDMESNAGLFYRLMEDAPDAARMSLNYVPGIQMYSWGALINVVAGIGINSQIRQAYGSIASRYRPGDRIFLFGFSRGAYAVRSLAGIMSRIGLLKSGHATERHIRQAFRYYKRQNLTENARAFTKKHCYADVPIEMIGVWDTVKSLGIEYPFLWRLAPQPTDFHDHDLAASVKNGFHALAMDETRRAFRPVMWHTGNDFKGHIEQVWFRGAHSDVGGDIKNFQPARPLTNIPLVWMLEKAKDCGLTLPHGWRDRFPTDQTAPAHGRFRGIAKFYLFRRRRTMLADPSEYIHSSAAAQIKPSRNWRMIFAGFRARRRAT